MLCSVCVATYKRPQLLNDLLNSLRNQNLPQNLELEVITVDNDVEKSAEQTVKEFIESSGMKIRYYTQPEKNICLTRNKAVHESRGKYILFVDDDEIASPDWAALLVKTLEDYKADAVFGRVIPIFNEDTPEWIKQSKLYDKKLPPTGEEVSFTRTSNCIVKADLIKSMEGPFDPSYGLTGGEDSHLFRRMKRKGAKYISCYEAYVTEYMPSNRTNINWLVKRSFRAGNSYTRSAIELTKKDKVITKFILMGRAFSFSIISIFFFIISTPLRKWRTHWMLKFAGNVGHLSAIFGYHYQEYK